MLLTLSGQSCSTIIICTVLGVMFHIISQPGELIAPVAKVINLSGLPAILKKLLICPYCLFGQISFWMCIAQKNEQFFLVTPVVIINVFVLSKLINKL